MTAERKEQFQLVPVEPTEEMLARGREAYGRKLHDVSSHAPTEHPDDGGGPIGYAYRSMLAAAPKPQAVAADAVVQALIDAALPFALHGWIDAEQEDDNCQLTRHSGTITVGDWRKLRLAVMNARAALKDPAQG